MDRAALDVALHLGIPSGAWGPKGRRAEDGPIPKCYPFQETESADSRVRTRRNVEDGDGTLLLTWGPATGGTLLTLNLCKRLRKQHCVVDLTREDLGQAVKATRGWLADLDGKVLNVAGPRGSAHPEAQARARDFLLAVLVTAQR